MRWRPGGARYCRLFGLLALGCLLAASVNGGLARVFFGWSGAAFFYLALCYGFLGPVGTGKSAKSGRIAPLALALLLPYFGLTSSLRRLRAALTPRGAHSHEILPGLWLGAYPESSRRLPEGCTLVIDLTAEFPVQSDVVAYAGRVLCLPTLDTDAPTLAQLEIGVEAAQGASGPVYVHCAAGVGRSATLVAAILMARGLVQTIDEAEKLLRSRRPGVRLTPPQRALLRAWTTRIGDTEESK